MTEVELSFLLLVCPQWAWKALSSPEGSGFPAAALGQALGAPCHSSHTLAAAVLQAEH